MGTDKMTVGKIKKVLGTFDMTLAYYTLQGSNINYIEILGFNTDNLECMYWDGEVSNTYLGILSQIRDAIISIKGFKTGREHRLFTETELFKNTFNELV